MSLRSSSLFLGTLWCASLLPASAIAQADPKGFYGTLYGQHSRIGASTAAESGTQGAGTGLRAEFGGGVGFGGDFGWRYGNGWAAEVEWNYRRHSLDALKKGAATVARDGDFASNTLLVNGVRHFAKTGAWTPYLGAGIGWVQEIDIDLTPAAGGAERGYSSGRKVAFQLIAGAEYALTDRWSLAGDARWLRVGSVSLDNEQGNPGGSMGPLNYKPLSVQLGLRYRF